MNESSESGVIDMSIVFRPFIPDFYLRERDVISGHSVCLMVARIHVWYVRAGIILP
jgi:hypothetical protein